MGRKPVPAADRRTSRIEANLTAAEVKAVKRFAADRQISVSDVIRRALAAYLPPQP